MPFGSRTRVGSRNHVLDEGPDLHKLLWCLWWFSVIRPSQHHCWSLQGPQSTYSKPVQVNHPPAFILPSSTTWTVGCWALPLTTVKPQLQQRCFSKHKPHAGHRNWPWPSNSSQRGTTHVFLVNLVQIRSAVPEVFHTQTKGSQNDDGAKNRTFRSSLRAIKIGNYRKAKWVETVFRVLFGNYRFIPRLIAIKHFKPSL